MINCSYASVTAEQVKRVFANLARASNSHVFIFIDNNPKINASTDITGVHMYTGMMRFLENEDQLAIILGHELGHVVNNDIWHKQYKYMETRADLYGFNLTKAAGYNACSGIKVLRNFVVVLGDKKNKTHPRNSIRYKALLKYCMK